MSREIPLTRGFVAIVDDDDYERVARFKWHAVVCNGPNLTNVYAVRSIKRGDGQTCVKMHRFILGYGLGDPNIDHNDTNGLNNQKYNLRPCTRTQNQANARARGGTSRFKGVSYYPTRGLWIARIQNESKRVHLGYFVDEVDAAQAYNFAAEELFGEFALFNTPEGASV